MKSLLMSFVVVCFTSGLALAEDLEALPTDLARQLATRLTDEAAKLTQPRVKIDGDVEKANGFHVPQKMGALIVPQKELKEGEELSAKFKVDPGASLAYLFCYHIVPVVDGKKVDASRFASVKIVDSNSNEHTVHVLLLAARQLAEDDYRLHVYGLDGKPIVDAKFAEGTGPGPVPVAVELKNPNKTTREGTVVVTVFGKYQASFLAAYTGE